MSYGGIHSYIRVIVSKQERKEGKTEWRTILLVGHFDPGFLAMIVDPLGSESMR
jgi:hypothetical protein